MYGNATWACAMEDEYAPLLDPLRKWQEKYDDNPFSVLASPTWEESVFNQLHTKVGNTISCMQIINDYQTFFNVFIGQELLVWREL